MRPDILPDATDDIEQSVVTDQRKPIFCYQTIASLAVLRANFTGQRLSTALAIYLTFTEVANARGGDKARSNFMATRKEIAEGAGVSPDTLDRYVQEFEKIGLLAVIRKKVAVVVNLPNRWVLCDPPSRTGAVPPRRTGAAQVLEEEELTKEEKQPPIPPLLAEVDVLRPANRPVKVARKSVTDDEYGAAVAIITAFNEQAGTVYSSQDYIAKIVLRLREHPSLTVDAHCMVIRRALAEPWWKGPASPSVVYGNAALFERSVHAVRTAPAERGMTAEEMEAQGG